MSTSMWYTLVPIVVKGYTKAGSNTIQRDVLTHKKCSPMGLKGVKVFMIPIMRRSKVIDDSAIRESLRTEHSCAHPKDGSGRPIVSVLHLVLSSLTGNCGE